MINNYCTRSLSPLPVVSNDLPLEIVVPNFISRFFIALALCTVLLPRAYGQGFGPVFLKEIETTFFHQGRISIEKVDTFIENIKQAQNENTKNLINYYVQVGGKSQSEAEKKALNTSLNTAYVRLTQMAEKLRQADGDDARQLAGLALRLGYAVRSEGRWMDYDEIAGYAKGVFKRYEIKRRNLQQAEASNLWNPAASKFYSLTELTDLKAAGHDLSRLDPVSNGAYWTDTDVSQQSMSKTYLNQSTLYQDSHFLFPTDGSTVEFDDVKRSQSRPKFSVKWKNNGEKLKFKLKFLSETHSEVTAATLLSALGFNTDPSRRINNVKIRFKPGEKEIFHRDMESYYSFWEMQQAVVEEGRDEEGEYFVLKEALLEARSEDLIRVGAWSYTKTGHPEAREVRALPVFMAWIANNDMKESGQNKTIFNTQSALDELSYVSGDLGWSFGSFLMPETVPWFKWNVIKSERSDSVSFNYITWHYSNMFQHTTWDDARWMVRRIAQLSAEQIRRAVVAGQWEGKAEKILIEKLIARRNQLVRVFELSNEFRELAVDFSVAPADTEELPVGNGGGTSGSGDKNKRLLDLVQMMSQPMFEYLGPSLMRIHTGVINAALDQAVKPITEIRFTGDDLAGLGVPFAAGLIVRIHRSIVRNEQPRNMGERFLVHDQMLLGWTLGTDLVGADASVTYYRSFNLVHPVRRQSEGVFSVAYLPTLLMPYNPGLFKLPNKHSLLIEDYVEGRGTLKVSGYTPVTLEASASLARVYLKRTLISDRADKKVDILLDNSHYTELSAQVSAALKVAFLKIKFPFFQGALRTGKIERELWSIPTDAPEAKYRARSALGLVAVTMRTDVLQGIAHRNTIDANFVTRKWGFNLFNMIRTLDSRSKYTIDESNSETPKTVVHKYQIENVSETLWQAPILDLNERDTIKTFFVGIREPSGELRDQIVGMNLRHWDSATTSRELRDDSVVLAQKASGDPNFIIFSPELHTNKDQWGAVVTFIDVLLYKSGIEQLLNVSEKEWWETFTFFTRIHPSLGRTNDQTAVESQLTRHFKAFLGLLNKARRSARETDKVAAMTAALGELAVKTSLSAGLKGDLIGIVLSKLTEDDYFISAKISSPIYKQNIFPIEKPLVNRRGTLKYKDTRLHDFTLNTISVIYNFFDSVIPVGSTVPSLDYEY